MSNRFRPSDPDRIQDEEMLDRTLAEAERAGIEVVLAVYPYPPREFELGGVDLTAFGRYLELLARRYPQVRQYVIGNEPNQPAFWRPLFRPAGPVASAAQAGALLAWAYDTLEAIDPSLRVVGVGLSPRGNDNPLAPSNASISPVRFIDALGRWYRASGRTKPLMDGFSFHPYPNSALDSLDKGYAWPNAGFANLDRIKQALWDAFQGTAQPTTLSGLQLYLDELGWQVDTSWSAAYTGRENVRVTSEVQAGIHLRRGRAACGVDPTIAAVNFFGLDDDRERDIGWQAGLYRADGTPRGAAASVASAIAETERSGCSGDVTMWRPAQRVVGAWAGAAREGRRRSGGRQAFGRRGSPRGHLRAHRGGRRLTRGALAAHAGRRGAQPRLPLSLAATVAGAHGAALPRPRALPAGSSASASRRRRTRRGRRRAFCRSSIDSEHVFVHDTNTCSDGSS